MYYPVEVLFAYFPFHHAEYLKDLYKGSDLIKLIIFIASSRTFLSEIDFLKRSLVHDDKRHT